jgi:mannonate dehydratase
MKRRRFLQSVAAVPALAGSPQKEARAGIKLGVGLTQERLNDDDLKFVRQLGVTHVVAHTPALGGDTWEFADLLRLRKYVNAFGMELEAIENFPIQFWYKILLGAPGREAQMENLKKIVRNMGKVGIPIMGYYFCLAGVWGHWRSYNAGGGRGGASIKSFDYDLVKDAPLIPNGQVQGARVEPQAAPGTMGIVSAEEMWDRLAWFLKELAPVAQEAGVRLGAHPDDPPVPVLRGTARLLVSHEALKRYVDLVPYDSVGIEFCQGTVTEMGQDVYSAIRYFAGRKRIFYVHFRNVKGEFPRKFDEVFIDEGDVDMLKAMRTYKEAGFEGVMIPDHSPKVTAPGAWHAGIAFALGYMRAAMQSVG